MWERPIQGDREKTDKHSEMKRKQNGDRDVRPGRGGRMEGARKGHRDKSPEEAEGEPEAPGPKCGGLAARGPS